MDLATAIQLLSLPRNLGNNPANGEPIIATQGRFGPFIKNGTDSRSLGATHHLLEITLEQALELLAQPKALGRGRGVAAPPLKEMAASPVTGNVITLRDGRYGPYVSDGETNASLPKDLKVDEITFEQALDLLAARAAAGGSKKKKTSKKSTTKKATKAKKKGAKKAKPTVDTEIEDSDVAVDEDAENSPITKKKTAKKTKTAKKASKKKN